MGPQALGKALTSPLPLGGRQENVRHAMASRPLIQAYVLHDTSGPSPGPGPYDVEITVGVAPDAMTRAEAGVTPLRQALAFQGQDAHQAALCSGI